MIAMIKKYTYQIEFLSREVSPSGTKYYGASGECLQKEMKKNFDEYLKKNALSTKGSAKKGSVLNAKGQVIGSFEFRSTIID